MSAREDILSDIRARRVKTEARPSPYRAPAIADDLATRFETRATKTNAEVRRLADIADVPAAIADVLRQRNMKAAIHLPCESDTLPWQTVPGLSRESTPPGPDDAALAFAPLAIAETGTLAYASAPNTPASWHFRAGLEIAVLRKADILPHMENVLARMKANGVLSRTVNFVTGPSRTGDIEQTLELGAHGPKELVILLIEG
jgi:L-lactate dehydrogenase complex protein LldG